jgi:hypothetical protein
MRIYLSGGMEYADDGGTGWRDELQSWLERRFDAEVFNPPVESDRYFSLHHPNLDHSTLKSLGVEEFRSIVGPVIDRDCREVAEKADLIICRWDEAAMRGAGTQGELTLARYFNKQVFLLTAMPLEAVPRWVIGCASTIVATFDELKNSVTAFIETHDKRP